MTLPAAPPPGDSVSQDVFLRRIVTSGYDVVPVVNSVLQFDAPAPFPDPSVTGRAAVKARRKAARRAAKEAERRRRHPERYQVNFSDWVAIPWRDRPVEARLGDYAMATAKAIIASPAWRDPVLDEHRLRLDPVQEASRIAVAAYQVYQVRAELGAPPTADGLGETLADVYAEKKTAVDGAFAAVVTRAAVLDSYRQRLAELDGVVRALARLRQLDSERFGQQLGDLLTTAAGSELAADATELLDAEASAVLESARSALELLGRDLAQLQAARP